MYLMVGNGFLVGLGEQGSTMSRVNERVYIHLNQFLDAILKELLYWISGLWGKNHEDA